MIASFAVPAAGGVFVPLNPVLKAEQVGYVLQDCDARVLLTSPERLVQLEPVLLACPGVRALVVTEGSMPVADEVAGRPCHRWSACLKAAVTREVRLIDTDLCAILYTNGSTGRPKGRDALAPQYGGGGQERGQLSGEPAQRHPARGPAFVL